MPNAIRLIAALGLIGAALAGCGKQPGADQNILIGTNIPADAEIEALPPDESSGTPANELDNGYDDESGNADDNQFQD